MMPPSISSTGIVPADRPDQRPLPNARSRMPFQSGLTVSGVAAFMPAVLAADWTVLELAAPVLPGLGGQHPERAIIADDRIGVHDVSDSSSSSSPSRHQTMAPSTAES